MFKICAPVSVQNIICWFFYLFKARNVNLSTLLSWYQMKYTISQHKRDKICKSFVEFWITNIWGWTTEKELFENKQVLSSTYLKWNIFHSIIRMKKNQIQRTFFKYIGNQKLDVTKNQVLSESEILDLG